MPSPAGGSASALPSPVPPQASIPLNRPAKHSLRDTTQVDIDRVPSRTPADEIRREVSSGTRQPLAARRDVSNPPPIPGDQICDGLFPRNDRAPVGCLPRLFRPIPGDRHCPEPHLPRVPRRIRLKAPHRSPQTPLGGHSGPCLSGPTPYDSSTTLPSRSTHRTSARPPLAPSNRAARGATTRVSSVRCSGRAP